MPEHIRQQRQLLEVLRFEQEPGRLLLEWDQLVQEGFLKALVEGPVVAPVWLLEKLLAAVPTSVKRRVLGPCLYHGRTELLPALKEEMCHESSYIKNALMADILGSSRLTTTQALELLSGLQARLDLSFRYCSLIPNPELLRRALASLPEPLSREKWASLVTLHARNEQLDSLRVLLDDFPHMKLGELFSSLELNFYQLVQQGNRQLLDIVAARLATEMATV